MRSATHLRIGTLAVRRRLRRRWTDAGAAASNLARAAPARFSVSANDLQLRGLQRGVRSSLVPVRKPSTRPGSYCMCLSRVLASAVSWAMSRLARLARERFRWDQTDATRPG